MKETENTFVEAELKLMRQTASLVKVNQINYSNLAVLFNCPMVDRAADSLTPESLTCARLVCEK